MNELISSFAGKRLAAFGALVAAIALLAGGGAFSLGTAQAQGEAADGYAPAGFTADAHFRDSVATGGPLNRWGISDPRIDDWAERQSREQDPEARRELLRRIWDRLLDRAYRIEKVGALRFEVYQPWLRNLRLYDATGDLGLQIARVWLDRGGGGAGDGAADDAVYTAEARGTIAGAP